MECIESISKRFWPRVKKTKSCWIWTGPLRPNGYGVISFGPAKNRKQFLLHRASWMIHFGTIPNGMCVLHKCDVRHCVRPDHLWLGTKKENTHDMMRKGRGMSTLSDSQIRRIRKLYAAGQKIPMYNGKQRKRNRKYSQTELARMFGVNHTTISRTVTRNSHLITHQLNAGDASHAPFVGL